MRMMLELIVDIEVDDIENEDELQTKLRRLQDEVRSLPFVLSYDLEDWNL